MKRLLKRQLVAALSVAYGSVSFSSKRSTASDDVAEVSVDSPSSYDFRVARLMREGLI